jgi:hypothetical protein
MAFPARTRDQAKEREELVVIKSLSWGKVCWSKARSMVLGQEIMYFMRNRMTGRMNK